MIQQEWTLSEVTSNSPNLNIFHAVSQFSRIEFDRQVRIETERILDSIISREMTLYRENYIFSSSIYLLDLTCHRRKPLVAAGIELYQAITQMGGPSRKGNTVMMESCTNCHLLVWSHLYLFC